MTNFTPLGDAATEAAVHALLSPGLPDDVVVTIDPRVALDPNSGATHFFWHGQIPGARGAFWITGLYSCQRMRAAGLDPDRVAATGGGLTDDMIEWSPCLQIEIDHLSTADQIDIYARLEAETRIRLGLQGSSGGKSIHAYAPLVEWLRADDPRRRRIQRLLIAVTGGDTQIQNPGRKMRWLGWDRDDRLQPVTRLDTPIEGYAPDDVIARLEAYAGRLGITDVDGAVEALQAAERCEKRSDRIDRGDGDLSGEEAFEAVDELREIARDIRSTLTVTDDQRELATLLGVVGVRPRVTAPNTPQRASTVRSTAGVQWVEADVLDGLRGAQDGARTVCPACGDPDEAVVHHHASGDAWVWCHRCERHGRGGKVLANTHRERTPRDLTGVELFGGVDETPAVEIELTPEPAHVPGRWWCPDIPAEPGVYFLGGPTGCGKTTAIGRAIAGVGSVDYITPSERLTVNAAAELRLTSYQDAERDIYDSKVAVCLPSLLRVQSGAPDLVVLDEVESLLSLLHAPSIMGRRGKNRPWSLTGPVYRRLRSRIRACLSRGGRVILSDANLSERTVRVIQRMITDLDVAPPATVDDALAVLDDDHNNITPTHIPIVEISPTTEQRARHYVGVSEWKYPSRESWIAELETAIRNGDRAMIGCDTRVACDVLYALLTAHVDPSEVLLVTGETRLPDGALDDVDRLFDSHRVVIYNSAVGQGVSYTGSEHKTVWLHSERHLGWDHLVQIRGRCRPASVVHSYVPASSASAPPPSIASVLTDHRVRDAVAHGTATRGQTDASPLATDDDAVTESHALSEWIYRVRHHDVHGGYYSAVTACGVTVDDVADLPEAVREDLASLWGDVRTALAESRVTGVQAATDALGDALDELRRARQLEPADRDRLLRMVALDRWGATGLEYAPVDDLVNRRSRLHERARAFRTAVALTDPEAVESIRAAERDRATVEGEGTYRAHYRADEQRTRMILRVLNTGFGIDLEPLLNAVAGGYRPTWIGWNPPPDFSSVFAIYSKTGAKTEPVPSWSASTLTPLNIKAFAPNAAQRALVRGLPGIRHASTTPTRTVGALIRALGIPVRRTRVAGENAHSIDLDGLIEWARVCRRGYRRMIGAEVSDLASVVDLAEISTPGYQPEADEIDEAVVAARVLTPGYEPEDGHDDEPRVTGVGGREPGLPAVLDRLCDELLDAA